MDAWQKSLHKWSLIVPVNDQDVLSSTLLRSPGLDEHCELILKRHCRSAAAAFNEGMEQAGGDIFVLAHQDVYLPEGWWRDLERAIADIEALDPDWGVLGPVGVTPRREVRGYVYSTGLNGYVGEPMTGPREVASLDEMVLVLRRAAGLRFDEQLPGFHLYGTDICLEAARRGMKCYAVQAFCIHNSRGVDHMPLQFWEVYLYLRDKWRSCLPVSTCCTVITRGCWPMLRRSVHDLYWAMRGGKRVGSRTDDPDRFFREVLQGRHGRGQSLKSGVTAVTEGGVS